MPVIDSDTHVIENEHTWEYMAPEDEKYRPQIMTAQDGKRYWFIDGNIKSQVRQAPGARGLVATVSRNMVTDEAKRTMEDIPGRLAHMDELGIDVQVLYPSIYITRMCERPETEIALSRSYNRWLADIWEQGKGRLRWTAMLPLSTMDEALKELRWCVRHGACGVTMRAVEGDRLMVDPYFHPVFQKARDLNVPITVHIGNSNRTITQVMASDGVGGTFGTFRLTAVAACHAVLTTGLAKQFPGLRFAFVEASSQWVPFVIHDLARRLETRGRKLDPEPLKTNHVWVTCQTDDDLAYVIKYAGEDNLVVGTDYGHQDQSSEIEAMRVMKEKGDVDPAVIDKIMGANAVALYGL